MRQCSDATTRRGAAGLSIDYVGARTWERYWRPSTKWRKQNMNNSVFPAVDQFPAVSNIRGTLIEKELENLRTSVLEDQVVCI